MKKQNPLFYHVLVFILAQIAWFSLLGLWIYWYVTNHILITKVGQEFATKLIPDTSNLFTLISGLVLLVVVSVGMSMIFIYLARQLQLTRLYDNFIANVTHELKSPLASIQLYLETMQSRNITPQRQNDFFKHMLKDVDRLNRLINSILYMSGLETKKTVLRYPHDYHIYSAEPVIRELIDEAAQQQKIPDNSIEISGNLSCRCVIDRNWMRIVFDNLFDNARKYSPETLKLKVNLTCKLERILIEVADYGTGIPAKELKKIFNKFHRIDRPDSSSVKGTGLGLYWVREIIKYHGGKISASSKGLGEGSTFRIELPVYKVSRKRYVRNLLKRSIHKAETKNE